MHSNDLSRRSLVLLGAVSLAGCAAPNHALPQIVEAGTRPLEFASLAELADRACAAVILTPSGEEFTKALPDRLGSKGSAPTPYIRMRVSKVVAGTLQAASIDLVSPGIDRVTGKQALAQGGPFLAFIAPAMYGKNDPAGGYVVVGGPAGVYANQGDADRFVRIDTQSTRLPAEIVVGKTALPSPHKTEAQLLAEGPF